MDGHEQVASRELTAPLTGPRLHRGPVHTDVGGAATRREHEAGNLTRSEMKRIHRKADRALGDDG